MEPGPFLDEYPTETELEDGLDDYVLAPGTELEFDDDGVADTEFEVWLTTPAEEVGFNDEAFEEALTLERAIDEAESDDEAEIPWSEDEAEVDLYLADDFESAEADHELLEDGELFEVETAEVDELLEGLYSGGWDPFTDELLLDSETPTQVTFPSGAALRMVRGATGSKQEHWDPHSTGNPLLDTSARSVMLSTNFSVGELTRSGGRRFSEARIDPDLVRCLQALREHVGKSIMVTSGYRSWGYNEELYRKRRKKPTLSRHCSGQAVDIKISGMSGMQIAKAAIDICGPNIGVGIASTFAHIDVRGKWAKWTYFSGSRNREARAEIEAYRRSRAGRGSGASLRGAGQGSAAAGAMGAAGVAGAAAGAAPQSAPDASVSIDMGRAVTRNQRYAAGLGWGSRRDEIARLVGFTDMTPTDGALAEAVAAWQRNNGLTADGIIGPRTWAKMRTALGGRPGGAGPAATGSAPLRKVKRGYSAYGGGRLTDAIRRLIAAGKLTVSERDIDTLQRVADVESSGQTTALNTWDSAVVSAGFKQWTLHVGKLQDLIRRAPQAFARHGIHLDESAPKYQFRWGPQTAIAGVPNKHDLRNRAWSQRFYLASLEPEAVLAAVQKALEDIGKLEKKARGIASRSGHGWSTRFESARGRALLAQLDNNRPAYVKRVIPKVLARTASRGLSESQFLAIFVEEIIAAYEARESGGRKKATRWTRKVMR